MIINKTDEVMSAYGIMIKLVHAHAAKKGLAVEFEETQLMGLTVKCPEAKGLWLDSMGGTCDGVIGHFDVTYQHCDAELKGIKATIQEIVDLNCSYAKLRISHLDKQLSAAMAMFE